MDKQPFESDREQISVGVKYALLAAAVSGVSIFLNKFALSSISPPIAFTAFKNVLVGVMLLSFILGSNRLSQIRSFNTRQWTTLISIGLIGGAIPFYLFFTGLAQTSAINGALIHKTLIFWVAILAVVFLKERISMKLLFILGALFYSNILIGGFEGFAFTRGEGMILLATLFWSVENIVVKRTVKNIHPDILATARMTFGSLTLLFFSGIVAPSWYGQILTMRPLDWMWIITTALLLFSYVVFWYRALRHARAVTVATILVGSIVVTNVLSAIFVTHAITPAQFQQIAIVVLCLLLLIRESRSPAFRSRLSDSLQ